MSNYTLESTINTIEQSFEKSRVLSTVESNITQILGERLTITKRHNHLLSTKLPVEILFEIFAYLSLHDIFQLSATCAEMYNLVWRYISTHAAQSTYDKFITKINSYSRISYSTMPHTTPHGILHFYRNLRENNGRGYQLLSYHVIKFFIKYRNELRLISNVDKVDYAICYMSISLKNFDEDSILTPAQKIGLSTYGVISGHLPFYYGYIYNALIQHNLLPDGERKNNIKTRAMELYNHCIVHKNPEILRLIARDFGVNNLYVPNKMNLFNYIITNNLPEIFVVVAKHHMEFLVDPAVYGVILDLINRQNANILVIPPPGQNVPTRPLNQTPPHTMLECILDILYEYFQLHKLENFINLIRVIISNLIELNRLDLLLFVLDKYSSYTDYTYSVILRRAINCGKETHNWSIDVINHFMKNSIRLDRMFLYSSCINADNSIVLVHILDSILHNIQTIPLCEAHNCSMHALSASYKPTDLFNCLGSATSRSAVKVIDALVERMDSIDPNMLYNNAPLLVWCVDKKTKLLAKFLSTSDKIIQPTQETLNLALSKSITDGNDVCILLLIKKGASIAHNNFEILIFALEKSGMKTLARKIKKQMSSEMRAEYLAYETREAYKTMFLSCNE
jgi:hypothetical protein